MVRRATTEETADHDRDLRKHDARPAYMAAVMHTPGPWAYAGKVREVRHDDGTNRLWCGSVFPAKSGKYRGEIAHIQSADQIGGISTDEAFSNARLIAAAPELLALLQELIDIEGPQPGTSEWANKVHAAIANATGNVVS